MTVTELNRGQLIQLKQMYLEEYLNNWADENEPISYNDILISYNDIAFPK